MRLQHCREGLRIAHLCVCLPRAGLAIGNVIGSGISNILGAFSLGALFHPGLMVFDRSSKIYTALLLVLTTVIVALASFGQTGRGVGVLLVGLFIVYVGSVAVAIYRGVVDPPEASDSDESGSGTSNDDSVDENEQEEESVTAQSGPFDRETSPLLAHEVAAPPARKRQRPRGLSYHVTQLVLGFIAPGHRVRLDKHRKRWFLALSSNVYAKFNRHHVMTVTDSMKLPPSYDDDLPHCMMALFVDRRSTNMLAKPSRRDNLP